MNKHHSVQNQNGNTMEVPIFNLLLVLGCEFETLDAVKCKKKNHLTLALKCFVQMDPRTTVWI